MDQNAIDMIKKAFRIIGLGKTDTERAKWLIDYAAHGAERYMEDDAAESLHELADFNGMDEAE